MSVPIINVFVLSFTQQVILYILLKNWNIDDILINADQSLSVLKKNQLLIIWLIHDNPLPVTISTLRSWYIVTQKELWHERGNAAYEEGQIDKF